MLWSLSDCVAWPIDPRLGQRQKVVWRHRQTKLACVDVLKYEQSAATLDAQDRGMT